MLRIRYSVKCATFRRPWCMACSSAGDAPGKSAARTGIRRAAVRSPVNQPVDIVQMTPAHTSAGSHRFTGRALRKLVDGAAHEREDVFAELRVDEALDLLTLRRV